ncbi:Response regulator receiver domain protein [uncultured Desulfatiglans sp.]|nr:Response regulator receiver domain protein [uncultured Desulfatiglans sp.]
MVNRKKRVLDDKRILAVDDEPDVLEALEEELEDYEGLVLDTAKDFRTGYNLIRSWTYDIVILDIMGVRGFDLLNAAVQLHFPVVMLTAHALNPESLRQSIELGARAYIPKENLAEITHFLEDVLTLGYQPMWRRVFDRLEGIFNASFGPLWQKDQKVLWEQVRSGRYELKPVILKK